MSSADCFCESVAFFNYVTCNTVNMSKVKRYYRDYETGIMNIVNIDYGFIQPTIDLVSDARKRWPITPPQASA